MSKFLKKIAVIMSMVVCMSIAGCSITKEESKNDDNGEVATSGDDVSDKLKELRESGVLYVGSSGDAPFAYIDQDTGEFKGVDAEIIKEIGKRLGIDKVEMKLIPFSELILNMNSGNIDIIADCMYIKKERAKQIHFGDVWYTQGGGLLLAEDSTVTAVEEFDPKTAVVGYTPGTIWQGIVEGWAEEGLIKTALGTGDQTESIVALQYGKIDGFLTDSTVVENLFANSPETVKGLKLAENYVDTESSIGHIAPSVTFENEEFMEEINELVIELRDEGFIDKVFEEYKLDPKLHMITNDERKYEPIN